MNKMFVVAEASVNYNDSRQMATDLIDIAVTIGVDAVEIQNFKAEKLASRFALKSKHQFRNKKMVKTIYSTRS